MTDRIKVLIVDDIPETRDHLSKLLGFESDVEVVGAAAGGPEAVQMATALKPDVVLMDINMPGMDGITATEKLAAEVPTTAVIMMSVQGEADYLRRSMLAGAREFLVKPFSSDELTASIRQVWTREKEKQSRFAPVVVAPEASRNGSGEPASVVAVFSPKGGVGRTTISVNLAVAAAQDGKRVALVDASFQFGDVGVLLNLNPRNKSIADIAGELQAGEQYDSFESFLVTHSSGVRVLLAPPTPEQAELISPPAVRQVLQVLRGENDLVVVDCPSSFNETTLGVLDEADLILTLLTLEITSVKNMRLFLEVCEQLGYGPEKIRLVLNRADSTLGIRVADVEHSIGRKVDHTIVSDGRSVVYALNRGVPFFLSNREAQVSQDIERLAKAVTGPPPTTASARPEKAAKVAAKNKSLFAWR
ncbi:MAG: response regulator [Chloroflexi bacterium]|nr:MAG: response regulator [Chloroflexota bacterium]